MEKKLDSIVYVCQQGHFQEQGNRKTHLNWTERHKWRNSQRGKTKGQDPRLFENPGFISPDPWFLFDVHKQGSEKIFGETDIFRHDFSE